MILELHTLAMLPIAHLNNRIEPFDRYFAGSCPLHESYRAVVNAGVQAYQLHTYLVLVEQYLGSRTARRVYSCMLDEINGLIRTGQTRLYVLELITAALETQAVCMSTERVEVEVLVEMNVALLLLLDDPQSPDFVPDPAQRTEQIGRIGKDVDWCFAQCLARGREAIADAFVPIFSEGLYAGHFTEGH